MNIFSQRLSTYIQQLLLSLSYKVDTKSFVVNTTPDLSKGDIAYPMFPVLSALKKVGYQELPPPVDLASKIVKTSQKQKNNLFRLEAHGPYVNVFLHRAHALKEITEQVLGKGDDFGKNILLKNKKIMIEFSGPNTNKPLHLGHLRNDVLGESMARLFAFCGAEVKKVNIVNDRGVHICKSMLAYKEFGEKKTPISEKKKGDHFVGDYYVKYSEWENKNPEVKKQVQKMLQDWENGDKELVVLWKQMNTWAIDGILETYKKTGVSFDLIYRESDSYLFGKEIVEQGLKKGVFYKEDDGSVWIDLKEIRLDKKLVLRADNTSVYITQDLGLAYMRYKDWAFDDMMYVVAREQNYHFRVLFYILAKLGFSPAINQNIHHLEYGMVHLPDGRMKSREGTVVDADELLDTIADMVKHEIIQRGREGSLENVNKTAYDVALGALHYYLLSVGAKKDVIFNPKNSIAFQGNTGPYLQYTCARISSMLKKFDIPDSEGEWDNSIDDAQWSVGLELAHFTELVEQTCQKRDPSLLTNYLYKCANNFATFYQNVPIANIKNEKVRAERMKTAQAVLQTLKNGLYLLNMPFVEHM